MFSENLKWMVIKSTPIKRAPLLKSILASRFPQIKFEYLRFSSKDLASKSKDKEKVSGLIAELKLLRESSLTSFDRMIKRYSDCSIILILSPSSYRLLSKRRPKKIEPHSILISETKSLSYMMQLPRVVEDLIVRQKLSEENQQLEKQIRGSSSGFFDQELPALESELRDAIRTRSESNGERGIQVRIKKWSTLKNRLGEVGQSELLSRLLHQLSRAVRSEDRILRTDENEFVIFLSHIDKPQLKDCQKRVNDVLSKIEIGEADRESSGLPFSVKSVDKLAYNS